uniref:Uncharacterized protein n=1 Tax=Glossina brevipalpis TaxID=37001 RepID=A0A1A9WQH0_9MUSC
MNAKHPRSEGKNAIKHNISHEINVKGRLLYFGSFVCGKAVVTENKKLDPIDHIGNLICLVDVDLIQGQIVMKSGKQLSCKPAVFSVHTEWTETVRLSDADSINSAWIIDRVIIAEDFKYSYETLDFESNIYSGISVLLQVVVISIICMCVYLATRSMCVCELILQQEFNNVKFGIATQRPLLQNNTEQNKCWQKVLQECIIISYAYVAYVNNSEKNKESSDHYIRRTSSQEGLEVT